MIDVMIVDDERIARRELRDCCERDREIRIVGEFADGAEALVAIRRSPPHLLFLDIQMDAMTGLQIARTLDGPTAPSIVFVTAYDEHALEAFDLNAVDYLLKPFSEERFVRMLDRVRRRRKSEDSSDRRISAEALIMQLDRMSRRAASVRPRLLAETDGHMQMVDVAHVEVVQSARNYVTLHVGQEILHARSTLQQAEEAMQSQPLLRLSRSCLVNINHVRQVTKTPRGDYILVLAGGTTVSSSEGYRDKVRAHLERLMLGSKALGE